MNQEVLQKVLQAQKNEITEYYIYYKLSRIIKSAKHAEILEHLATDEKRHYNIWKKLTGRKVKPSKTKIIYYTFLARIFGLTFSIKLMERGEELAQGVYKGISAEIDEAREVMKDEQKHEAELISLIDEGSLKYVGSVVLGLNDALVELTGILAGLTFALRDLKLIAVTGLVTGIAAGLSMAASEYLSTKTVVSNKRPFKAAVYTGITYLGTVAVLITPYLIFNEVFVALGFTLALAILIIFIFNFYISVAKQFKFWRRFLEMVAISMGIAIISFGIGYVVRNIFGVEI
ncbi:MAG: VIT1/CCC1 transporter family protein [bacterium]